MNHWYMVTVIGGDQKGIVAAITRALYEHDCNLGETSMSRLGGNFSIMMMVDSKDGVSGIETVLLPVTSRMGLHLHIDSIRAHMHEHLEPNVQVRVFGADRPGIVAEITEALATAGLNILDLDSEIAGTGDSPVYVMIIDGYSEKDVAELESCIQKVRDSGIDVTLTPLQTLVG